MKLPARREPTWRVRLALAVVTAAAFVLAAAALTFGIWATLTKNAELFGRQTALSGILSFVLAAIAAAVGMLIWARKQSDSTAAQAQYLRRWRLIQVKSCSITDVRVHTTGAPNELPPPYVERDHDSKIIERLQAASVRGGFILVVGGSSTGKSRSLITCIKAILADWQILIPEDPSAIREAAGAGQIKPRTVIWLDDTPIEKFISANEDCITAHQLLEIMNDYRPIIISDSMWPSRFQALNSLPDESSIDVSDSSREARDGLALAGEPIRVAEQFSEAERQRAAPLASNDERLAAALADAQFGVTQTLAGAAWLVGRYRDAQAVMPSAYGIITGALDVRRIGYYGQLPRELLKLVAHGYLSARQFATVSDDSEWFDEGLRYATDFRSSPGFVAPLIAERKSTVGAIAYSIADYLLQYDIQHRRLARIPAGTWDALLVYANLPADLRRIARAAESRLMYGYAERFHRAAEAVEGRTSSSLPQWLAKHNRADELRERTDSGDREAGRRLAGLLTASGALDELRQRADSGDQDCRRQLANWLAASGEIDELRRRANSGDRFAQSWFSSSTPPERLGKRLRTMKRNALSRSKADSFYDTDRVDELRELADFGDPNARRRLSEWLIRRQYIGELRDRADGGDVIARNRLANWLAANGHIKELRERADAGDTSAFSPLADWLAAHDEIDELRWRADAGNKRAKWRLADWLALNGYISELRQRAEQGDANAGGRLAHWLIQNGQLGELRERADAGDESARRRLAIWLYDNRQLDELRERAEARDSNATDKLVSWLADNGPLDELRELADKGVPSASVRLADKLCANECIDELRAIAERGNAAANSRLVGWLVNNNRIEELRNRAVSGDLQAAKRLAELASDGLFAGADLLVKYGLSADGNVGPLPLRQRNDDR